MACTGAALSLAVFLRAAELIDLGQGLNYLRVRSLAESADALRSALVGPGALVIDVRYAVASPESVEALRTALAAHPKEIPLFVLVSPSTPAPMAALLGSAPAGLVTLGGDGSQPTPRVIVLHADAAHDRQAYEAFDHGTPVERLISGKVEKERFDEATLMDEFKKGNTDAEPKPPPDPTATSGDTVKTPPKPEPVIDRVLQRAVNLHRALLALRPEAGRKP